jgi:hypothetical protein
MRLDCRSPCSINGQLLKFLHAVASAVHNDANVVCVGAYQCQRLRQGCLRGRAEVRHHPVRPRGGHAILHLRIKPFQREGFSRSGSLTVQCSLDYQLGKHVAGKLPIMAVYHLNLCPAHVECSLRGSQRLGIEVHLVGCERHLDTVSRSSCRRTEIHATFTDSVHFGRMQPTSKCQSCRFWTGKDTPAGECRSAAASCTERSCQQRSRSGRRRTPMTGVESRRGWWCRQGGRLSTA